MNRRRTHNGASHPDLGVLPAPERFGSQPDWFGALAGTLFWTTEHGPKAGGRVTGHGFAAQFDRALQWAFDQSCRGKGATGHDIAQFAFQHDGREIAGHASVCLAGAGKLKGIDIGQVSGTVVQTNSLNQWAKDLAGKGKADQEIGQAALQHNELEVTGDVSFSLAVGGKLKGDLHHIDIGQVAGEVVQVNLLSQWAQNHSNKHGAVQEIDQAALQGNWLKAAGDVSFSLAVAGNLGSVHHINVGLIAGEIVQSNSLSQWAQNQAGKSGAVQGADQAALQGNGLEAIGSVSFSLVAGGNVGTIHDVNVGLIAGDITQTNLLDQWASNGAQKGGAEQLNEQTGSQANWIEALGHLHFSLVIEGSVGSISGIDVGLITGGITQVDFLGQWASNHAKGGAAEQINEQAGWQTDWLEVLGSIDLTLVVEGSYHEAISDIRVGLAGADILQSNSALQLGINHAAGADPTQQINQQPVIQANVQNGDGHEHITITLGADFTGAISDLDIGLILDNTQTNDAVSVAINWAGSGWHLIG